MLCFVRQSSFYSQTLVLNVRLPRFVGIQSRAVAAMSSIAIVLHRNDLRLHDNEALTRAHKNHNEVIHLFCFDPRLFGTTSFGFPKTGVHRARFLIDSVQDLKENLRDKGSELFIRNERPEHAIKDILEKHQVKTIYMQKETCSEEINVERKLQEIAMQYGATVNLVWGSTLIHIDDLPFSIKDMSDIYTPFRKQVEAHCKPRTIVETPELKPSVKGLEIGTIPTMSELGLQSVQVDNRTAFPFVGGETAALKHVHEYIWTNRLLQTYKETRNGLIGADYSSKFSAWLMNGCLSPRFVYREVQKFEHNVTANESTYWLIFELLWRDFFKFLSLKVGNKLFFIGGPRDVMKEWSSDVKRFNLWRNGKTGHPFVDANMRELLYTGWMSNRGRQNVASFLTKDMGLDWRMGAEWFESMLVDYDVTSNWGNWTYSAGVGSDPRENRYFNIQKQSKDYDSNGDFVRLWVPELKDIPGSAVHAPWLLSSKDLERFKIQLGLDYPLPFKSLFHKDGYSRAHSGNRNSKQQRNGGMRYSKAGKRF